MKMRQRKKLQHLDLFSGIGGFSLGLESAGLAKTVAFCDIDNFCQKVLKKHWPEVPIFSDIKELTYEKLKANGINNIDIITGGYPCQPFSVAGRKKGEEDPRHVWPEYFRIIKELRPTWVIGENVGGHIKLGLDTVLENLESEGYSARTFSISAASIGANHKRERVWILANSKSSNRDEYEINKEHGKPEAQKIFGNRSCLSGVSSRWEVEPDVGRVADGLPDTMDRLKSLGNSVVPQIPFLIGSCIKEIENI
jgi:DNA (cytosine-5)-methyltransferase 1